MAESKFRIPRVATAVMVLGAGAATSCGDDDGPNTSDARVQKAAEAFCEKIFECFPDYAEEEYGSESNCVRAQTSYVDEYRDELGKKCLDAQLDYYECFGKQECSDVESECEELGEKADRACGNDNGDEEAGG